MVLLYYGIMMYNNTDREIYQMGYDSLFMKVTDKEQRYV